ncbi:hypothetical protein [Reichenbachiella sp.]|uniref:toxin-antitoxin system YwqK family antitoxin n=1 Tax=Reichenbachiella sp. TaxID=2184521 RepID=UPI00329A0649
MRILLMLLLFSACEVEAQPSKGQVYYFNENWKKIDKNEAKFFRIVGDYIPELNVYNAVDYFISGEKYSEGTYDWPETGFAHGTIRYFYKSGEVKKEVKFSKSKAIGNFKEWYKNGDLKLLGVYEANPKEPRRENILKIMSYWNENGVQTVLHGSGEYFECDDVQNICQDGTLKSGLKEGVWNGLDKENNINFNDLYKKGVFVKGASTDEMNNQYKYSEIRTKPTVKGGEENFSFYILRKIDKAYKKSNFEGKVYISFIVTEDEKIMNFDFIGNSNFDLKDEVSSVLKDGPEWRAGTFRGKKVKTQVILPLTFHH